LWACVCGLWDDVWVGWLMGGGGPTAPPPAGRRSSDQCHLYNVSSVTQPAAAASGAYWLPRQYWCQLPVDCSLLS